MSKKHKIIVFALLAVLIGAAFYLPGAISMPGGDEEALSAGDGKDGSDGEGGRNEEKSAPAAPGDEEFAPSVDPSRDFTTARENNRPVVVKFYARW